MPEAQRFFFVHVMRTGGTTFEQQLRRGFPRAEVYPDPDLDFPGGDIMHHLEISYLLGLPAERLAVIRLFYGHFPYVVTEMLGGPLVTLTVLRDPVERTLSYLRHHRESAPDDGARSLEEIYADPVRIELARNHMVKMLSLSASEMTEGALTHIEFTRARLERAKAALESIDVVGFQEDFETFCDELTARFGWDLGPPIFMNRTKPVDVPDDFLARIAEDNALDIELYEFARTLRPAHP